MSAQASETIVETVLVVRELPGGEWSVCPLADPTLVSYGSAEACLEEQRLFLVEHLARSAPDVIARFALPAETSLEMVGVVVPRPDLPQRLQIRQPVVVPAAVIPRGRDRWVVVLPLRHTFYATAGDDLHALVRKEVQRVCLAREIDGEEYRTTLLAAGRFRLERLRLTLDRFDRGLRGGSSSLREQLTQARKRTDALEVLKSVGRPLHEQRAYVPPLVGREREFAQLGALLGGTSRSSILLVGRELTGKTTLFRAWMAAERAKRHERLAYATSAARLIAGMSGLGQWQERVKRVMTAAETLDAIVVFESLGDLFSDRPDGLVDLPGALKPYLDEGRVRVLGEITPEALGLFESRWTGFLGPFQKVRLEPLSAPQTSEALVLRAGRSVAHGDAPAPVAPDAIATVVGLVDRYLPYGAYPGKAIRLFDEARSAAERDRSADGPRPLRASDVYETFSRQTGIPLFLLQDDRPLTSDEVTAYFAKRMVGQRTAVRRLVETVSMMKANLQPAGRPLASFLFIGPTGVGKTELARCLATFLFGSEDRMVRFDMSEYQDPHAAERLIRGTDRAEGLLTRRVRRQPFGVVLLDEIEKAHPAVHDLLLQVLGEGRLTDARGRTAYFHNAVLILTSNVGSSHREGAIGMTEAGPRDEAHYLRELGLEFRPEFLNRISRVIPFERLSPEEIQQVAALSLRKVEGRRGFMEQGLTLQVSGEALARIGAEGYSPTYGARALRRAMEDRLVAPVARLVAGAGETAMGGQVLAALREEPRPDATVVGRGETDLLQLTLTRGTPQRQADTRGLAAVSALRRDADRWFRLGAVETVKDRIEFLIAQLSQGGRRRSRANQQAAAALAQSELHRLQAVFDPTAAVREEIHTLEEIALGAFLEGADDTDLSADVERARRAFRRHLVDVLVVQWAHRDEISVLLIEVDAGALDLYLLPLLEDGVRRGWSMTLHAASGPRTAADRWPTVEKRVYGPPRTPDQIREWLAPPSRPARGVILRVKGPNAGAFLSLEAGVHRWVAPSEDASGRKALLVQPLCPRSTLKDADWANGLLAAPVLPSLNPNLGVAPAMREHVRSRGELRLWDGKVKVRLRFEAYWPEFEEVALEHLLWDAKIDGPASAGLCAFLLDDGPEE